MKAGTLNHLKTKRLKRRLGIPLYQVVGLLESLWQITTESADEGDIGRFPDDDIALALEWEGDSAELINALVECGWIDRHPESRLVIHDWMDHAPNFVKERLRKRSARSQQKRPHVPPPSGHNQTETGHVPAVSGNVPSIPCPTDSNHAQPIPSTSSPGPDKGDAPAAASPGWEEVEEGLKRLKVSLIRPAIQSARDHGFTPPQVLALVAYLETNPKGCQSAKGAIYNRLVEQGADAVDWLANEHWPWSDANTKAAAEPPRGQTAADRRKILERDRALAAEQERLITAHTSTLAAMDDDDLGELIQLAPEKSRPALSQTILAKGRDSPMVKLTLLELIDKRAKSTEPAGMC